jgi:hypothetical protein
MKIIPDIVDSLSICSSPATIPPLLNELSNEARLFLPFLKQGILRKGLYYCSEGLLTGHVYDEIDVQGCLWKLLVEVSFVTSNKL